MPDTALSPETTEMGENFGIRVCIVVEEIGDDRQITLWKQTREKIVLHWSPRKAPWVRTELTK